MSVTLEDNQQGLTLNYDASGRLTQAVVHTEGPGQVQLPLFHAHHLHEQYSFMVCATFDGQPRWAGSIVWSSCGGGGGQAALLGHHGRGTVEPGFAEWPQQSGLSMPVLRVPLSPGTWQFHHC